ncbi:PIN domain-containing protein [Burkholderia sp. LMU1-1-1.1]|uniref:PIN domain-containing protein n=1 Tax=Burkholderia sp. LMU1-1-1.1 TaxID=3135266 RepID=UPI00341D6750
MTHLVFDTNILIDYLSGQIEALSIIDGCANPAISKIVYMEVMVGCKYFALARVASPEEFERILASVENMTRAWINSTFKVLPIDEETADLSIEVRKQTKKKLPDTVIHATAMLNGWPIVTRNPRDFTPLAQVPAGYNNVDVIVPYSLP